MPTPHRQTGDGWLSLTGCTKLDMFDHDVKDRLRVRHYVRCMDVFIVLLPSKAELWDLLAEIRDFLAVRLRLSLYPKTGIFPASHGVDFAGYRHWPDYVLPRKRNVRKAARRFKGLSHVYARGALTSIRCARSWRPSPATWPIARAGAAPKAPSGGWCLSILRKRKRRMARQASRAQAVFFALDIRAELSI